MLCAVWQGSFAKNNIDRSGRQLAPVFVRHDAFHEGVEHGHGKSRIAVGGSPDHAFGNRRCRLIDAALRPVRPWRAGSGALWACSDQTVRERGLHPGWQWPNRWRVALGPTKTLAFWTSGARFAVTAPMWLFCSPQFLHGGSGRALRGCRCRRRWYWGQRGWRHPCLRFDSFSATRWQSARF